MFAPASTNANVVKNFHSGKLNSCAARATASKFGFKQHIGQIVVGKARFEAPFL